jgi:uncharacterized protein YjiS (DUF1127 family)
MATIRITIAIDYGPGSFAAYLERARGIIRTWRSRAASRRQLCELSEHELKDIGLTRAEAASEAAKPFWFQ